MANKFILAVGKEYYTPNGIIVRGYLRYGDKDFHAELLTKHLECIGGGEFSIDKENKTFTMWGSSADFGIPQWNRVEEIVLDNFYAYEFADYIFKYESCDITQKIMVITGRKPTNLFVG